MSDWLQILASMMKGDGDFELCKNSFFTHSHGINKKQNYSLKGLNSSSLALFIRMFEEKQQVIIVSTESEGRILRNDLETFDLKVLLFPTISSNVYYLDNSFKEFLHNLVGIQDHQVLIIPLRTFLRKLPSKNFLRDTCLSLKVEQQLPSQDLIQKLVKMGYFRVPKVSLPGEFTVRGEIIDICIPGEILAYRIHYNFGQIAEIKMFDIGSQISNKEIVQARIPSVNMIFSDGEMSFLLNNYRKKHPQSAPLTREYLLSHSEINPLFISYLSEKTVNLENYLAPDIPIIFYNFSQLNQQSLTFHHELSQAYKEALHINICVPAVKDIFFDLDEIIIDNPMICFENRNYKNGNTQSLSLEDSRNFFGNIDLLKEEFKNLLKNGYKIFIFAGTEEQAQRVRNLVEEFNVIVVPRSLNHGFSLTQSKIFVLCEHEIFGRKKRMSSLILGTRTNSEKITSFLDLNPGDYIVHMNYGIGKFRGLDRLKISEQERDYISLVFANDDIIYLPIEQINLIQRYIGNQGNSPKLDRIGSKSWETKKAQMRKASEDIADYLLELYAQREKSQGFAYPKDDHFQLEFEADFPYEETEDQLTAMEDIKTDMESPRPMDRLICGDVGYGKTELAMRATFKAIIAGKQVVILCPTTILVEQHYESFIERFQRFPFIKIFVLSRLTAKHKQTETLKKLSEGEVDVIIGTHRLLGKDVFFRDLGLFVVDEEQRFGIKDKEKIKKIKSNVDTLVLSATPIPRTLHMSLVKLRDLSTLQTPPSNRQSIKTFVEAFNPNRVQEAIRTELNRKGQVFYLHNHIETLEATKSFIQSLVPEAQIGIVHGKMSSYDLDDSMYRFIHNGFQILVATSIIENGINIPNVNTIIIDRADMYGISQLYQLRGRVGRSERLAYAYLFYPQKIALSELAMQRLNIINDFSQLGDGFKIAMKDMEIRGTGNLLGIEQSGHIQAVGFDMYLRLLNEAIEKKISPDHKLDIEPYLELEYSGFITDSYINDIVEKIEIYKKISSIKEISQIENLYKEMIDRFGEPPEAVMSLLKLAELRCWCRKLSIHSLKEHKGKVEVDFIRTETLNVDKFLKIFQESGGKIKPDKTKQSSIIIETGKVGLKEKSEFLRDQLSRF